MKKCFLPAVYGVGAWLWLMGPAQAQIAAPTATSSTPAAEAAAATPTPTPALDFGDGKSSTLTGRAWKALEAKDYDSAVGYADKCIEKYQDKAVAMQKALTAPPSEKEETFKQWALNDVGASYYVKGKALDAEGKKSESQEAYKYLVDNLSFAQCWDPQGWFWKPADAARDQVKTVEFDALK